jgi:hypothetical protein
MTRPISQSRMRSREVYLQHALFRRCGLRTALFLLGNLIGAVGCLAQASMWVRPTKPGDPLIWGRKDGVVFGLHSSGGIRGPRGLIRVGLFLTLQSAEPELLNFIAVEPVVEGPGSRFDRMAFSELEMSQLDPGQRGKRLWVDNETSANDGTGSGRLETLQVGKATVERLTVRIDVERFAANGAHVYVVASIDSDHPDELRLRPYAEHDSPPIDELTVTATMGNYERLRQLWLKDRIVDSRRLYAAYAGDGFIEDRDYPLEGVLRSGEGDAVVFCTSNETDPAKTPGNETAHWVYILPKLTQYWRVPGRDVEPNFRVRVNGRRVYWSSKVPVLGGAAFENFEVRERFVPGQSFIFGITPKEPKDLYQGTLPLEVGSPVPAQ